MPDRHTGYSRRRVVGRVDKTASADQCGKKRQRSLHIACDKPRNRVDRELTSAQALERPNAPLEVAVAPGFASRFSLELAWVHRRLPPCIERSGVPSSQ